jgi:hypothetical protein
MAVKEELEALAEQRDKMGISGADQKEMMLRRLCVEYAIQLGKDHDFKLDAMERMICFLYRFITLPSDLWMPSYQEPTPKSPEELVLREHWPAPPGQTRRPSDSGL